MSEFATEQAHPDLGEGGRPARDTRPRPGRRAREERRTRGCTNGTRAQRRGARQRSARRLRRPAARVRPGADRDSGDDRLFGEIIGGLVGGGDRGRRSAGSSAAASAPIIGGILGAVAGGIIGHLASRRTVTINVTKLAGVADTVGVDVARANTVYRQASLHVQTAADPDTHDRREQRDPRCRRRARQLQRQHPDGRGDHGSSGTTGFPAASPPTTCPSSATPACAARRSGRPASGSRTRRSSSGVSTRKLDTLAHELGHALTNDGSHLVRRLEPHGQRRDPQLHGHADPGPDRRDPKQPVRPMSDDP